jgi:hypothetical protein
MTSKTTILVGALAVTGLVSGVACGDDDETTGTTSAPTTSSSSTTGSGGGTTGSGGTTTTTSGTGGGGGMGTGGMGGDPFGMGGAASYTQDCDTYCNLIETACTGANDQWGEGTAANDYCKATCATWPAGSATDTAGDTLGCRIYHTYVAGSTSNTAHCSHGGPHGGPADDAHCTENGETDNCGNFCRLAQQVCTGGNQQWTNQNNCETACAGFTGLATIDTDYSAASTGGDTFACRYYHLTAAAADPGTHCDHIAATSSQCN